MRHAASRPVFVDRTGRRRRIVLLAGVSLATILVSGLVVLAIGISGGAGWHVPGFPVGEDVVNGADVGSTPTPTLAPESESPEPNSSAVGAVAPGATPDPTSPRRFPTQTPPHPPKPTKT
jgi:hypothetical protein